MGRLYYEYSSRVSLEKKDVALNKENEKLTNFYHIFFNLIQDLRTSRQLSLSYEKSKEKLLSFRDRFELKDFTEKSEMGSILTGALDTLIFMGENFFNKEEYSNKLLTESICKANMVIKRIEQDVREINATKEKLGLGYNQNIRLNTFIEGCEPIARGALSSKKVGIVIYSFQKKFYKYFGPDGKLNDKFLKLFGIEKFVNE